MVLEMLLKRTEGALYTVGKGDVDLTIEVGLATRATRISVFAVAHGPSVRGDGAVQQLEDEAARCVDLAVSERDPLVNEGGLLGVGA